RVQMEEQPDREDDRQRGDRGDQGRVPPHGASVPWPGRVGVGAGADPYYNQEVLKRPPYPRTSAAAADKARRLLERALGASKVIATAEGCLAYAGDESDQEPVAPDAVVLAETADDIARALAIASEAEVPIVPRAAGSGKSGGAVPVAG